MSRLSELRPLHGQEFSCAQVIFSTYAPEFGLDARTARRVAGAFGAGMARLGETCGAVTGALMLIGLKHSMVEPHDIAAKEKTYEVARRFIERFAALHGSIRCKDLLGLDLSKPGALLRAKELGLFELTCPALVESAAQILEEEILPRG